MEQKSSITGVSSCTGCGKNTFRLHHGTQIHYWKKKLQSPWPLVQQKKSVLFHNDIQKRANYIVRKVINTKKSFSFRYYPNHLEKRWLGKAGSTWISQPCLHVEKLLTSKSTLQDSVYIVYLQGAGGIFGPAGQTRSAVGFMNGSELVPRNEIPIFSCWKRHDHLSTSFVEIGYNSPNLSNQLGLVSKCSLCSDLQG